MSATVTPIDEFMPMRDPLAARHFPTPATVIHLPISPAERDALRRQCRGERAGEAMPSDVEP